MFKPSEAIDRPANLASRVQRILPILVWLPGYRRAWLAGDLVAGVTLAAYAIPVSLAYGSLAGVPPEHGIYCYLVGGLAYALFGTSRQLAVGPTSATAMIVGAAVGGMAAGDPARAGSLAALVALGIAIYAGLAWILQLSGLVSFLGDTILTGYKAGAALTIGMSQLPALFGVPGGGDRFPDRVWRLVGQLGETRPIVLVFGLASILALVLGERWLPRRPVALAVVALATLLTSVLALAERGVVTVGTIPTGLPTLTRPSLALADADAVLPLAAACFLLAYVEGVSAARALADKGGGAIDPRQELLALGAANLAASVNQGFPVGGGLSQSAVNESAGARTPLSLVVASLAIGLCLVFLTPLVQNLPTVVLAAIVLVAVRGLVDVPALRQLWHVSRYEFGVALVALVGVLLLGLLQGVMLAVVVSLLMLLAATARPHVAFLGRIPGTSRYSDLDRHHDNEVVPGVLIFRVEAALVYFNVEHVQRTVCERILETQPRLVVCDMSNSPFVDIAGAKMLAALHRELQGRGIQLRIVEAHARIRDLFRAEGLEGEFGHLGRRISLEGVVAEFTQMANSASLHPAD